MPSQIFDQLEELLAQSTDKPQRPAEVLRDAGVPTTSVAILDDGEISSHCISSIGDNTDTLFQACSISKPTAGMAVMRLVEEGLFSVQDKIRGLLPPEIDEILAEDPRTEAAFNAVTIAHLMSHTAGLSMSGYPGYPYGTEVPSVQTLLAGKEGATNVRIGFCSLPGAEFIYSGGGTTILQCIMEHQTKMAFPDIMKKYILEPLGMSRSFYRLPDDETNVTRCFYQGYKETEYKWHYQPELAAAGLWTTPSDLLKLARAMQDSIHGEGLLRKDTAKTMLTRVAEDVALGWFITSMGFSHSGGNMPGWRCFMAGYSDLPWNAKEDEIRCEVPPRSGIAIMTNSAVGITVVFQVFMAIAYLKGWPMPVTETSGGQAVAPFRAPPTAQIDMDWKEWTGEWGDKWRIECGKDGSPEAGVDDAVMLKLRPAAIPNARYEQNKRSIDLLVDGTELMLRLGWKDDKRVVDLWNGAKMSCTTLERK